MANITESASAMVRVFTFGFVDYVVFGTLLLISSGIGVYFGFFSKSSNTTDEYLMGGKRMKTFPIAISLVASQLSGIAIMTLPVEIYAYGINFIFNALSMILVVPVLCYVVVPVFYENNVSNCYEYLQRRFNKGTQRIITVLFLLTSVLTLPVFIFIPSLAFSQVTGINIHLINTVVSSICVFYTMLGGIKAVVWTDVVQGLVMIGSSLLVAVMGVNAAGGIGQVFENAIAGGRLSINFNFDLTTRATFWNSLGGSFCMWSAYVGLNQSCVQRIVALPSLSHAKKALYMFEAGFLIIMLLNLFTGVVIFAKYHDCDPIAIGVVDKADKMVPYFVQDVVGYLSGIPGVFISCVFSASLSTISANLNSLSGVIYFDYVKPFVKHTEWKANLIMKILVVMLGVYSIVGGIAVEKFKSILQVTYTIHGASQGIVFGIFTLGMLVPRVHGKAAFISLFTSLILMLIIVIGAQLRLSSGKLLYKPLPTWTDGCEDMNITLSRPDSIQTTKLPDLAEEEFSIFDLSYFWYPCVGVLTTWLIAITLSFFISSNQEVDRNLLSPVVRSFVKERKTEAEKVPLNSLKAKIES